MGISEMLLVVGLALSLQEPMSGTVEFSPASDEASVPDVFRLDAASFDYEGESIRVSRAYTVWAVRFPSPIESPDPENNTIHAEYFRPNGVMAREGAGVVVLHILGADFALSRYMAVRLAERGVAALFVKLPYYGERRAPGTRFLSADIERSMRSMRQGVCDVRRAASWLASRPEVDPARVGVAGISLGGIISALAAAVDPSIEGAALLLAGGGLADILWDMPEREARQYREAWIASGRDFEDLEVMTRPLDPLTYAERLVGRRVLMIAGNVDEVIPPRATRSLWEAAGCPPLLWYDCGHYSAAGFLLPAIRITVDFFADGRLPEVVGDD